jgi:hypothetical protein
MMVEIRKWQRYLARNCDEKYVTKQMPYTNKIKNSIIPLCGMILSKLNTFT